MKLLHTIADNDIILFVNAIVRAAYFSYIFDRFSLFGAQWTKFIMEKLSQNETFLHFDAMVLVVQQFQSQDGMFFVKF